MAAELRRPPAGLSLRAPACHTGRRHVSRPSQSHRSASHPIPVETGLERSALVDKDPNFSPGKILLGLLGPEPITVHNNRSPRIEAELTRLVNEGDGFDSVQVEGVHLVSYIPLLRAARRKPLVIADWHNIESEIMWRYSDKAAFARRLYARRTAQLIENMELKLLRECDIHLVCSARERAILQNRVPDARIEVVGNGVDVEFYSESEPTSPPPNAATFSSSAPWTITPISKPPWNSRAISGLPCAPAIPIFASLL